jgi:hypothetical protein
LYKEGKSVLEKVVKETFKPDRKKVKKSEKVIEPEVEDTPKIEEEPGGGVFEAEEKPQKTFGRGAVVHNK